MAKKKSVVDTKQYQYKVTKVRDSEGRIRHSAGCGDAVAKAMLGLTHDELLKVAKTNGVTVNNTGNNGLYRMSLGHALRGLVRNDTPVKIGKHVVKSLKQKVALPKAA